MSFRPDPGGRELAIATTFDDSWVPHFATCALSIARSRGQEDVRFLILKGPDLSAAAVEDARDYVRHLGMALDVIDIPGEALDSLPPTLLFSPLVWYRLLLPELLPDLDRVLALDADTLVLQSLLPLYERDLGDNLLAAVTQPVPIEHRRGRLDLDVGQPYFNAGVMLMNLAAMREENFGPRAIALGHERYQDFIFAEQDALNVLASQRWEHLHPKWNALSYLWLLPDSADGTYPALDRTAATASPAVVHFEGFQTVKPWFYRSVHPLRHLYRDFRAQTPWPLEHLERRSVSGALLRTLPIRWQYALTRAKGRLADVLPRRGTLPP